MPAPRKSGQPATLVEHLAEQAPRRAINNALGVKNYYTSADLLLRQVRKAVRTAIASQVGFVGGAYLRATSSSWVKRLFLSPRAGGHLCQVSQ